MSTRTARTSSAPACTRGASGAATSPSTAWSPPAPRSPTPGLDWRQIQFVAGADTIRNGYPGFIAGATFAQKLGWNGVPVSSSYAACASGSQALQSARAQILAGFCDVALVIGADTTPEGLLRPGRRRAQNDPDWLRFHLHRRDQPDLLRAATRAAGWTSTARPSRTSPQVKVKNARHGLENPNARFRKEISVDDVLASPVVVRPAAAARHLRHVRRRGRADRGEHVVRREAPRLAGRRAVGARRQHGDAALPAASARTARHRNRLHRRGARARSGRSRTRSSTPPTRRPASGPTTSAWPRSTTCPPRSSSTGTSTSACAPRARPSSCCAAAPPPSAAASRSTRRGGLACFGEAIPAQAIAQVCELTWQLKGQADRPPGRGRQGRHHRQPGPVRPRLVGHRRAVTPLASVTPDTGHCRRLGFA